MVHADKYLDHSTRRTQALDTHLREVARQHNIMGRLLDAIASSDST
jgi:hypothetical protein